MELIIGIVPYLLFALLLFSLTCLELVKKNTSFSKISLIIILFFVFLLLSLKATTVGQDAPAYEKIYNGAREYNFLSFFKKHKTEPLFYIPLYIFSKLNIPSFIFWALNYFVMCVMLFLAFKNTKRPIFYLSVFLMFGFFRMSFSGLRQSIAVSICTCALIQYINSFNNAKTKRNAIIYCLLIVFASLYHISSLFLLLIPLFFKIKFDFKYAIVPFVFLPFVSEIGGGLFTFISQYFSYAGFYQPISGVPSLLLLISVFLFFIYYGIFHFKPVNRLVNQFTHIQKEECPDKAYNSYFILFFIYCFFLSCNTFNGALCRFSIYFYICIPFYIDNFIYSFKSDKIKKVLTTFLFIFLFAYFLYEGAGIKIIPYEFFF